VRRTLIFRQIPNDPASWIRLSPFSTTSVEGSEQLIHGSDSPGLPLPSAAIPPGRFFHLTTPCAPQRGSSADRSHATFIRTSMGHTVTGDTLCFSESHKFLGINSAQTISPDTGCWSGVYKSTAFTNEKKSSLDPFYHVTPSVFTGPLLCREPFLCNKNMHRYSWWRNNGRLPSHLEGVSGLQV